MVAAVLVTTGIVASVIGVWHLGGRGGVSQELSIQALEAAVKIAAAVPPKEAVYTGAESPRFENMSTPELQRLIEAGDVTAMIQLGLRFNYGPGERHDFQRTKELITKAASYGSNAAQGLCCLFGWGRKVDHDAAFVILEKGAKAGSDTSMSTRLLARCYQYGWGTRADPARALKMYGEVAAAGNPQAEWALASCHLDGIGTEKNTAKALKVLEKYESLGYWLHLKLIGDCHSRGGNGIKADVKKAETYYRKAAAAGYPDALAQVLQLRITEQQRLKYGGTDGSRADAALAEIRLNQAIAEGEGMIITHPRSVALRFKVGEMIIKRNRQKSSFSPQAEALNLCAGCVEKQPEDLNEWHAGLYLGWLRAVVADELQAYADGSQKGGHVVSAKYVKMLENVSALSSKCVDGDSKAELAGAMVQLGKARRLQGDVAGAMKVACDVVSQMEPALRNEPYQFFLRNTLALAHDLQAVCAAKSGDGAAEVRARQAYLRIWGVPYLGARSKDLLQEGLPAAGNLERLRQEMEALRPLKDFVFFCDVGGARVPVTVYVGEGINLMGECQSFMDQVQFLAKERGVIIPSNAVAAMKKLSQDALQNQTSLIKVLTDALDKTVESGGDARGGSKFPPVFQFKS